MKKTLYVVKPALLSLGSLIADGLTKVKTIWVNNEGAIGTNILKGLPPLCCGRGLLSERSCAPFGRNLLNRISNNRVAS